MGGLLQAKFEEYEDDPSLDKKSVEYWSLTKVIKYAEVYKLLSEDHIGIKVWREVFDRGVNRKLSRYAENVDDCPSTTTFQDNNNKRTAGNGSNMRLPYTANLTLAEAIKDTMFLSIRGNI